MKKIVGVHFWEKKIHLCWGEEDSISTASFNLPQDLRRDDLLTQEFLLEGLFKAVKQYLNEKLSVEDFGLVICVPDDFGVKDIQVIYDAGQKSNIEIVDTIPETMAYALFVYGEYDFDGRMLSAVIGEGRISIAEYDFSERGVEKIATYIAGAWNGTSFARAPYINSYSNKLFDGSTAGIIFTAGSMNGCMTFEQSFKKYVKESEFFVNSGIEMKMMDGHSIVEGLGYMCGKLEGRDAFMGLGIGSTLSPYEFYVGINSDVYQFLDSEMKYPKTAGIELKKLPESGLSSEKFVLYEKKGKEFLKLAAVNVPTDNLSDYFKKAVWIGTHIDENRKFSLIVQNVETDSYIEIPFTGDGADEKEEDEGDVSGFIEKILPIIDNLEYASKFAKDQDNPYTQGIIQSYTQAIEILEKNGVSVISGEGEPFDFNLQNAVAHVADVDLADNTVKQVMQTGYMYKGKVIRTASVIVAN